MALYVSIILLGALVTVGSGTANRELLSIIWGTTIGLALAHFFAFRIASRLHRGFAAHRGDLVIAYAQAGGAAAVRVAVLDSGDHLPGVVARQTQSASPSHSSSA